jgi:hypothetical protein
VTTLPRLIATVFRRGRQVNPATPAGFSQVAGTAPLSWSARQASQLAHLVLQPHLVIEQALSLVMAVAGSFLVAVAPS